MGFTELFILAVGLAMDALRCLYAKVFHWETKLKHSVTAGLYFGGFQAIMPLIGYIVRN